MSFPDYGHPDSAGYPTQKKHSGLSRLWHASLYSIAGLRAGWAETAFRQEVLAAVALLPCAAWLGQGWVERALLAGTVVLVLIVELLNTAIESAIDRVDLQWHALSKRAKDLGSAAVMLSMLLCGGVWADALWHRLLP